MAASRVPGACWPTRSNFRANLLGVGLSEPGLPCLSAKSLPQSAFLIWSLRLLDKSCVCFCSPSSSNSQSHSNNCAHVTPSTWWPQGPLQTHPVPSRGLSILLTCFICFLLSLFSTVKELGPKITGHGGQPALWFLCCDQSHDVRLVCL